MRIGTLSLENDMTSSLATRQDLQQLEKLIETRLEALESRVALMVLNRNHGS